MNSFQELNFYSNTGVPFTDDRAFSITFSANTATNSNISVDEGNTFTVIPGIQITNVISTPRDIIYTVNVASLAGATVTWPSPLPDGIVANTGGSGIYRAYGVNGRNIWNQIKSPTVNMPRDYNGTWTYSATITYPNTANTTLSNTISWTNTVTAANLPEITATLANVTYNQYASTLITPAPQIIDLEIDGTYSLVVSANGTSAIGNVTSGGLGGNVNYNSGNRTYTITGLRNEVNSHLGSLQIRPEFNFVNNFTLYYTLTNPVSATVSQTTQNMLIGLLYPVLTSAGNVVYDQDTAFTVTSTPQLPDDSAWLPTVPTYTVTVTPSTTSAVSTMSSTGSGGTSTFNSGSKVLTITGTRSQVNSRLNNITLTPGAYFNSNFTLSYLVTSPGGTAVVQNVNIDSISLTLTIPNDIPYDEDVTVVPMPSVPAIQDVNFGIASTTLPFTMNIKPASTSTINTITSFGNLSATKTFNNTTKVYSIVGNLAQIRSELANVSISPGVDYTQDFNIYYTLTTENGNVNANVQQTWLIGGTNVETINTSGLRYYTANTAAYLFPNNVPQINETVGGSPVYAVKLVASDGIGAIVSNINLTSIAATESTLTYNGNTYQSRILGSADGWNFESNTLTITGTKNQVNSALANVYYVPHKTISANTTVRFEQYRDDVLQTNVAISLIGTNNPISTVKRYTYTQNQLAGTEYGGAILTEYLTPTFDDSYYYNWDILAVAGGGAPGYISPTRQAGPGGAGGLIYETNTNIFRNYVNANLAIRVGPAAYDTTVDGNTTISSNSVELYKLIRGGRGGGRSDNHGYPGQWGGSGGGGAYNFGAAGDGVAGQGFAGTTGIFGGSGGGAISSNGAGFTSNISGNTVTYSKGPLYLSGAILTPGSGGNFQGNLGPFYVGQPGIVVIKLY